MVPFNRLAVINLVDLLLIFHDNFLSGRSRWVVYSNKYGYDYDASQVPPEWLVVTKCNFVFMDFTQWNPLLREGPVIFCL